MHEVPVWRRETEIALDFHVFEVQDFDILIGHPIEKLFLDVLNLGELQVLNWEKCHFMVREGIVLGHLVSERGIEVDKAKIDVIERLPPPVNVKGIRSFLGHAGFYRRFIKDFSQIARPLTNLLAKDAPFEFTDECLF